MYDPVAFQQSFGAALAGHDSPWLDDPAIARALTVHRNTATMAALDALAANFPVIHALVGDEAFTLCDSGFVQAHPPSEPRLCLYGARFDSFLASYAPFAALAYLPDIAALERLVTEALFAADAPVFDGDTFAIDKPLPIHPACRFASFATPAAAIWAAHQAEADPDALEHVVWGTCVVIVTRPSAEVLVNVIDAPTALFLEHCNAEASLGNAAAAATEAGGALSTIFSTLITIGAFRASDIEDSHHA